MSPAVSAWIEPSYLIPSFMVLLSSGLFPFLIHIYKLKRDRAEKLFDARKTEYQAYFKTIEVAARLAGQDYDRYLADTLPPAMHKLLTSNNSPEAILELQATLQEFTKSITDGFQKATNELLALRIVSSQPLLLLLDRFEGLYQQMMKIQPLMLAELRDSLSFKQFLSGDFSADAPSRAKMIELGTELATVRNAIILQMRNELGYKD